MSIQRKLRAALAQVGGTNPPAVEARSTRLRRFPGLPEPAEDAQSQRATIKATKEATETILRARGDVRDSAVTVGELEDLGILRIWPNGLVTSPINDLLLRVWTENELGDLVPTGADQWVGDADRHPEGIAVGTPTDDLEDPGVEGVVVNRTGSADGQGGIAVFGYRAKPTFRQTPDPGTLANAPTEISGVPVLLMGPNIFVESPADRTESHYLLVSETSTLLDGRRIAALELGPRYVPTITETFTDPTDYALDVLPTTILGGSTFTNAFAANDTQYTHQITLTEESDRRTSTITVEVWGSFASDGGVLQQYFSEDYPMGPNSRVDANFSTVVQSAIAPGDTIELRVSAVLDHQQADPWVRGTLRATTIEMRQG